MDILQIPLARELFNQWKRARGARIDTPSRPFSRGWEKILADAGLHSGLEQDEAVRDAHTLATAGLLRVEPVKYYPHRIARLVIPLEQEDKWKTAFGYAAPSNLDTERFRTWMWEPELKFCSQARLYVAFEDVWKINAFLKEGGRDRLSVPIKERSLDIFGDEKRLDELYRGSSLFGPDRLALDALNCFVVPEPLPWVRGADPSKPLIVLENVATWDSYRRWNEQHSLFGAVVYGGGDRFREGVLYLHAIYAELGGQRDVYYFGDLDRAGLRIPCLASARAVANAMPPIQPHLWSYRQLLKFAPQNEAFEVEELDQVTLNENCQWLGELGKVAHSLFARNQRLAQEHIGWEFFASNKDGVELGLSDGSTSAINLDYGGQV